MIGNYELEKYLNDLLEIDLYSDFCPNGLQVEGKKIIKKIICGVTAGKGLIEKAIIEKADAIIVHHGYFWKGESLPIKGIKKNRIKLLLENDINLYGYHLPLDCHNEYGNNAQLAKILNISNAKAQVDRGLIWTGNVNNLTVESFAENIGKSLSRKPMVINSGSHNINKIAWCTGAAQNYIEKAADMGVDAYISGEVSEQTYHLAKEYGVHYFSAGHHATERYGIKKIAEVLNNAFDIPTKYVDINNPI